jgi:hypothetical protein
VFEGRAEPAGAVSTGQQEQLAGELVMALTRLRAVHGSYWDSGWRREHRGSGRYPEHHLWEAVQGYLDLYDATTSSG